MDSRFKVIRFCYFLIVGLVVIRLFYWQILQSDSLQAKADEERLNVSDIQAPRGDILFSDGTTLATIEPNYLIYAQPKLIADKVAVAKVLAQAIYNFDPHPEDTDPLMVQDSINQLKGRLFERISEDFYWVSINKTVNYNQMEILKKLNIAGIGFQESTGRFYPEGSESAHLLGFVGSDVYGNPTGYFGLEGFYNGELRGVDGKLTQEVDAQGQPILIGNFVSDPPKNGETLILNVDRTIQSIVETDLKNGMQEYGAKSASAIVMDPKTGAVLALASFPSYDPSKPGQFDSSNYKDAAIADSYEPGSTFKVLVMAAALNEGLVTPDTKCDSCAGPVQMDGYSIETWNNQYFPNTNMTDVIVHSDNTGMVFVSQKLGLDKMFSYIQKFGFGALTGIDLQDEDTPDLRPKNQWHNIDLATSSFGQGISATELQMITAISAIANGGKLLEPHVVKEIDDGSKKYTISPKLVAEPISAKAASTVKDMMVQAVDRGEAQWYKLHGGVEDFKIAGKTGTAQIPVAGHYDSSKTIASFVGFAPSDDPKFIIIVRYDEPTASIYGAETAAPTFFDIARQLFLYYGIAPDEPHPSPSPE